MYHATMNPNGSSSLPASPPPFTPPNYTVWVNALWFLSLVISLTCALLATLLQQWARRYLKVTQPRYSPHKRARIQAFFAEGVDKFLLPWTVEALPTMLHLSLFLFFAGLAVFLWNVNLTIFKLVLSWVGLCTALYGCITFIPVFRHDSPYQTPISLPLWHFVTGIPFLTFRALGWITFKLWIAFNYFSHETSMRFRHSAKCYRKLLVQGMRKTAEEIAFESPSEIDTRAFLWTFDSLDEDHELERFFAGLPGFCASKMVKDPLPGLRQEQQERLLDTLIGLSDCTSSSDLLQELVKNWRTVICRKAIGQADIPDATWLILRRIASQHQYGLVQSAKIAHLVRGWDNVKDYETMIVQAIVSSVVTRAQRHDDLWFAMAADEISVPESVLRTHAMHGDNLSLAVLIHIICKQFTLLQEQHWPYYLFWKVLDTATKFDMLDTSPELQHKFCALWNEVIPTADWKVSQHILRPIRSRLRAFGVFWAANLAQHLVLTSCLTLCPQTYKTSTFQEARVPSLTRPSRLTQLALTSNTKFVRFPPCFCLFIASSDAAACFTDLTQCLLLVRLFTAASSRSFVSGTTLLGLRWRSKLVSALSGELFGRLKGCVKLR
jgi:hypothetical protein